jgi:hypothetical protein
MVSVTRGILMQSIELGLTLSVGFLRSILLLLMFVATRIFVKFEGNKMKQLTKNEIADLEFDAEFMGFRVVYLPKPLDWNHFVLYYLKPELTYVGHYRGLNEVKLGMQKHYKPEYSEK